MEENESPTEQLQEEIHHHGMHSETRWVPLAALSSALIAALAAVASLIAGHHSNEAMIDQIKASDHWSHYQAKSVKAAILHSKIAMLEAVGKKAPEGDQEKLKQYDEDQNELTQEAQEREAESAAHMRHHQSAARSVTLFQLAIAMVAIAVLVKRRRFWFVGLAFGLVGLAQFVYGALLNG